MEKKYTKKEILKSQKYEKWREWLKVNLPDEGTFTEAEVEDYMTPLFEETNAIAVDQVFDGSSSKPQSGVAMSEPINYLIDEVDSLNSVKLDKEADGSVNILIASDDSEAEVLRLGIDGKTSAVIRANENGALFHGGFLGVWSLDAGSSMTKDGKEVATEEYVDSKTDGATTKVKYYEATDLTAEGTLNLIQNYEGETLVIYEGDVSFMSKIGIPRDVSYIRIILNNASSLDGNVPFVYIKGDASAVKMYSETERDSTSVYAASYSIIDVYNYASSGAMPFATYKSYPYQINN